MHRFNAGGRQPFLRSVQDSTQHLCLLFSRGDKGDTRGVVDDRVGEGDAAGGRFRGILKICYPPVCLGKQFMAGEKGSSVSICTHTEQDQIKHGEPGCILLGKFSDELLLIRIGKLLQVIEERRVQGMDVAPGDWDFGEESFGASSVV